MMQLVAGTSRRDQSQGPVAGISSRYQFQGLVPSCVLTVIMNKTVPFFQDHPGLP